MKKPIDAQAIEDVYFEAMLHGYANPDIKPLPNKNRPGFKFIEYKDNGLTVIDEWTKNKKSGISAGRTTIWTSDELLWIMNYFGHYHAIYIPFLKEALLNQYEAKIFNGGRGPKEYVKNSFSYYNYSSQSNFEHFLGKEVIIDQITKEVGFHEYNGILLWK